jgi:hypothetical protein
MLKRAWQGWKRIAHAIGNFQARVLLTLFYFVLVWPVGFAARLFSDPLRIKDRPKQWLEYPTEAHDLEWARRQ